MLNQALYNQVLEELNKNIPDDYIDNGIYRKLISTIAWLGYRNLLNATDILKQVYIATADPALPIGFRMVNQPQSITGVTVVYASKLKGNYALSYNPKTSSLKLGDYPEIVVDKTTEYDLVPDSESITLNDYDSLIADNHFVVYVDTAKLPSANVIETITVTERIGIDYLAKAAAERNKKRYINEPVESFRERVINGTGDETCLEGLKYELATLLGYTPQIDIYTDEHSNWCVVGHSCVGYGGLSSFELQNNGILQERYRGAHTKERSDCLWYVYITVKDADTDNQLLYELLNRICAANVKYHVTGGL